MPEAEPPAQSAGGGGAPSAGLGFAFLPPAAVLAPALYGMQAILLSLSLAGLSIPSQSHAYHHYFWAAVASVVLLLGLIATNFRLGAMAFPALSGPMALIRDALGEPFGSIARGGVLTETVLVVAVSVAAGAQILLALPGLQRIAGPPALAPIGIVLLVTLASLPGAERMQRTAQTLFVGFFVLSSVLLFAFGLAGPHLGWRTLPAMTDPAWPADYRGANAAPVLGLVSILVVLRAVAAGASSLNGWVLPRSEGAEHRPTANRTGILRAAGLLVLLMLGYAALANNFQVAYWAQRSGHSPAFVVRVSALVFGTKGPGALLRFISPMGAFLILLGAASSRFTVLPHAVGPMTSAISPPLSSRDSRRLRLLVGFAAVLVLFAARGDVDRLVGPCTAAVFLLLTLMQCGLAARFLRNPGPRCALRAAVGAVGGCGTAVILFVLAFSDPVGTITTVGAVAAISLLPRRILWPSDSP
jgi:hypothetical protein